MASGIPTNRTNIDLPNDVSSEILQKTIGSSVVMRLARQIELPGRGTSINVITPGMNKTFGMTQLLKELNVEKKDILYFGDMTQPGGNDYPVVQMGIDTITVRSHEDTAYALRGILGVL